MKSDAIKLKIRLFGENLIDMMFSLNTIMHKIYKSTAKFWLYQNMDRLTSILSSFEDSKGEIDTDALIQIYDENIFDGDKLVLDISLFTDNETIKQILPNHSIVITKDDLYNIFKQ